MVTSCCKNIRFEKVFVSSLAYMVIAFVVRQIELLLTMKYYLMHEYFNAWSLVMMPILGSTPPANFFILSILFSFVTGLVLALLYEFIKSLLADGCCKKACQFSCLLITMSLIFFSLPAYLLFNTPLALLVSWFFSQAIISYLVSLVFVKVLD